MPTYTEEGSVIKGNIVVAEARKISKPQIITKTGRHKAVRIILKDNAECIVSKKLKYLG